MKQLSLVVVLIAATGISVAFRNGLSGTSEAALKGITSQQIDRAVGVDRQVVRENLAEPGLLRYVGDIREAKVNDVLLARIAAECGNHLFELARRQPHNTHLLRQAAQHYRACLSHESTASDPGTLFKDARARLDEIETLMKRPAQSVTVRQARPAPAPSVVVNAEKPEAAPAPAVVEEEREEPRMFGPDGIPIRRVRPDE